MAAERDQHAGLDPAAALRRIAYLLERAHEPTYRVRAFRRAADVIAELPPAALADRATHGRLRDLPGIGTATERVVLEALAGTTPAYLASLEAEAADASTLPVLSPSAAALRTALRGDCHTHSDWSDGGSPIEEMARAARDLGHDYVVLTDHSPRLTVARGLSAERLLQQLDVVARLNGELAPFRILTGIEVDILPDGALDQSDELLDRLDVVVASVHSKLRMDGESMTRRMVAAAANPHTDVLGHCTGRLVTGRGRPPSDFDADVVFAACERFGVAVEVNSRPERLDPPRALLRLAEETGCRFSIDTDAHAPGQLEWLGYGVARAAECGITADRVVNTMAADDLVAWAARHD